MKFEQLSPEDQKLVATEFDPALEKAAAAEAALVNEMYDTGFSKLAAATADELDKLAEEGEKEEDDKEEEKLDEESEKKAAELAAFIERGYFDGLRKLGSERHGDENHYLYPFIAEKLAAAGKMDALKALKERMGKHLSAAKGKAQAGAEQLKAKAKEMQAKAKGLAGKAHEKGKAGGYHALGGAAAGGAAGYAAGRASKE